MDFLRIEDAILQGGIREGDTVIDVGTGAGHALVLLSRIVGESGKVYAFDVQKNLLLSAKAIIDKEHLENIETLWGDVERVGGIKLPDRSLNYAVIVNTFFQFEDKAAALKEIRRVLKSGGRILLVDWADSYGNIGPGKEHVVNEHEAEQLLMAAGFTKEKMFQAGPHHYGIVVKNP
jgi:ubiquinone/menaquinone biosynthesis C-methylase UbiE